jgi:midasin (ATPase involved in ribosome maturation)
MSKESVDDKFNSATHKRSIVLSSQIESLKNVVECVILEKPVIFCGPSDCGKTKIIDTFCSIFNKNLYLDTIDNSVTGSFQQFGFNRMLEDVWQQVEVILFKKLSEISTSEAITSTDMCKMTNLFEQYCHRDSKSRAEKELRDIRKFDPEFKRVVNDKACEDSS